MVNAYIVVVIDGRTRQVTRVMVSSVDVSRITTGASHMYPAQLMAVSGTTPKEAHDRALEACRTYFPHLASLLPS